MARFSQTEQLAQRWLSSNGYKKIVYQRRATPDFMTDKGGFEVKRLQGSTIRITQRQIADIKRTNSKVLVFRPDASKPEAIIEPSAFEHRKDGERLLSYILRIEGFIVNVTDVDEDVWNHFQAQCIIRKVNTGELLSKVLREWLSKESFNQRARVQ